MSSFLPVTVTNGYVDFCLGQYMMLEINLQNRTFMGGIKQGWPVAACRLDLFFELFVIEF